MRIVGGTHRSRKLETPKSNMVRPTSDKVRLAVFNMLNSRGILVDAVVIDAFCGTGALGLEALSQGAKFCYFFDKNKDSLAVCKTNITSLKEEERSHIQLLDATKIKEKPEDLDPVTLIFLDPPYRQNLIPKTLESFKNSNWLAKDCFFVIEIAKEEKIHSDLIEIEAEKIYGDTKIILSQIIS